MIGESLFIYIVCSMEFQFVDTSVLIYIYIYIYIYKSAMISLFIVAYSTKHSLIFKCWSLGYLSLSSLITTKKCYFVDLIIMVLSTFE